MRNLRRKLAESEKFLAVAAVGLFLVGICILWLASLRIPALDSIEERRVDQSTKIYDRTGQILLYDFSQDVRRQTVPLDDISLYAQEASISIEDKDFYKHHGFDFTSFLRALWTDLKTFSFSQGGSTITQQVVKNSILTNDKTPTRKLKELILAIKLEKVLTKQQILALYFNEIPYGGNIYGIEEASQRFFGKDAKDLTLTEAAYLAAIPKAPTYYSPYGTHVDDLEARKNLVLKEMLKNGYITQAQEEQSIAEKIDFKPRENTGSIKAPHFVFYVIDQLVQKYGEDAVQSGGWKVITTLDYDIQQAAEATAKKYGDINQQKFNANNNAIVAIDPKTGDILAMTGSRDYFDKQIDGNFNAAISHRQPGSTFKPFVYSVLFNKGYTDSTVLWDVPIQFNPSCAPDDFQTHDQCYSPVNYDDKFRGPMTIRNAIAQSINLPAVQASYLAGVKNSVALAQSMGINFVGDTSQYGLSLVLGGGSVSLLDMTSAYGVFANDGVRNPANAILSIQDGTGNVVDSYTPSPVRVLPEQTARIVNNILADNVARTPGYGPNSPLNVGPNVAVKTGTSNDYRDTWIIGYSPDLVIGAWTGNNDNSPMDKKTAGLIVSPIWREMMDKVLSKFPSDSFVPPDPNPSDLKPVLLGQVPYPPHSILYYVYKDNPRGPQPANPASDPQFSNWEYGVTHWAAANYTQPTPQPQTQTEAVPSPTVVPAPTPGFVPVGF